MNGQQTLDGTIVGANGRPLTDRQQLVYDLLANSETGLYAEEVGAYLHHRLHRRDTYCEWCPADGRAVLTSKALGPLVVRWRGGLWQLRGATRPTDGYDPGTSEIPF